MTGRGCVIEEFATTDPNLFIEVKVRYVGKPEFYGGEEQGYWLSIVPYTAEISDGVIWRSTRAYSGMKKFLVPATRYSESYMRRIVPDWGFIRDAANAVAARCGVEIKEAGA